MERLIVYETDKGNYAVRPEHWAGIIDKNGRIKEYGLNHTAIFHYKKDAEWYADAKNAEEQGLLLRLPCKVGDTVYSVISFNNCNKGKCTDETREFCYGCENLKREYFVRESKFHFHMIEIIGKTVFLTKEEAEQALAKMEGGV